MVGREERIDHRSLEAQGLERKPGVHLGPRVAAMERRDIETARGRQLTMGWWRMFRGLSGNTRIFPGLCARFRTGFQGQRPR